MAPGRLVSRAGVALPLVAAVLLLGPGAAGHGFIESPVSRMELCGEMQGPDGAKGVCGQAFAGENNKKYCHMCVLTHNKGRKERKSKHVCGFDSETWGGGRTPWDKALDWPTQAMKTGWQWITWDIRHGPHWWDTMDFRYYITKPGFRFDKNRELTWDDFDTQPFCEHDYEHDHPTRNPDVVSDVPRNRFHTNCDVPWRDGHAVIYGEWGRSGSFERFHGCIDAEFGGGGMKQPNYPPPRDNPKARPDHNHWSHDVAQGPTDFWRPPPRVGKGGNPQPAPKPQQRQCQTAQSGGQTWHMCKGNEGCCPNGTKCFAYNHQVSVCLPYCPASWQCSKGHRCQTHSEWMLCKGNEGCCPKNTKCHAYTNAHSLCTATCPSNDWQCARR